MTLVLTAYAARSWPSCWPCPWPSSRRSARDRPTDILIRGAFQVGLSTPVFYLGLVLLTVFAANLRWFPVGGYGDTWGERLYSLFLPALTLALSLSAVLMRNLRASIIEVLHAEYVDFARAKGLAPRIVLSRHVLRNALISTVTLFGLNIGTLIGGAVITETVFAIPGAGRLMIDSIYGRDYPVVQGLTLVAGDPGLARLPPDRPRPGGARPEGRSADAAAIAAGRGRPASHPAAAELDARRGRVDPAHQPRAWPWRPVSSRPTIRWPSTTRPAPGRRAAHHLFGTDNFGRDVLSRVIWAYRIDLQIALFATIVPLICRLRWSGRWSATMAAGRRAVRPPGRRRDHLPVPGPGDRHRRRCSGPGLLNMYIAVSVVGWVFYARLLRGEIRVQKPARLCRRRQGAWATPTPGSSSATCCPTPSRRSSSTG